MNKKLSSILEIHSWSDALAVVQAGRRRPDGELGARKLEPNVHVFATTQAPAGPFGIRLYESVILVYFARGTFTAHDGGYNTPTTIRILNRYGPTGWTFYHRDRKLMAQFGDAVYPCANQILNCAGGAA